MKRGILVEMAILYEDTWETARITIPNTVIVKALGYDKLNEIARNQTYNDPLHKHCVGAYLFNEHIELELEREGKSTDLSERIWGILDTVNQHFGEEMSDILDEDFDELLQELAGE